ncbi:MAG: D-alanine--D-alanine ligase [Lacibacter sp.]|jgi:hypothetical protein
MKWNRLFTHHPFFIRLFNWEYWSFNTVYGPVYIIFAVLIMRTGFRYFFSAANPSIKNGGFLMEEKQHIYPLIPKEFYPAYFFVPLGTPETEVKKQFEQSGFSFPVIAKPVVGMQGKAVKKVKDLQELLQYASLCTVDFMVQEFSPYTMEVGIFYHRIPGEAKGTVSGIVAKEPMKVTGDGVSSLYQLICEVPRYILQMNQLNRIYGETLLHVLPKGEEMILVPYGNHARGSKFLDWTEKADSVFIDNIDKVCRQIDGFFYGRLDMMYSSWEELRNGTGFHIIELNGAGSDPTHMYDPRHSIFFAWKEIVKHWLILFRISRLNHKKGIPYMSWKEGLAMFKANTALVKKLDAFGEKI